MILLISFMQDAFMADDTNGKPTPPKVRPLQPASEHHPKELSDSRARAETAAASRQPTDVPDIRHRIREVLTREIEIKRLSETFSTKPEAVLTSSPEDITADDDAHRSALPWREDTAPPASPIPSRPGHRPGASRGGREGPDHVRGAMRDTKGPH